MTTPPAKDSGPIYWHTPFNVTAGCSQASPGCSNCWAEALHGRFHKGKDPKGQFIKPFSEIQLLSGRIDDSSPYYKYVMRGEGKTVFVCNSSDLFHPDVPSYMAVGVTMAILANPQHRFLILTKRPERMSYQSQNVEDWMIPENAWFGTTCEDQKRADKRIPHLLRTPAKNRWLSIEPLLGPVDLKLTEQYFDHISGGKEFFEPREYINWVVVGAESGPNRRPCKLEWVQSVVDQCQTAKVPVFVKQLDIDGKCIHDIEKFPADLRIRQLPWEVEG